MKKVFVSLCMASVLMGLSSCASTKNAATLSSISGEWNIIEVNGTAVVPANCIQSGQHLSAHNWRYPDS